MTCVEKKFELQGRKCKWEEYKGTRYSDGDSTLVVELWLHRVADDLSGLTFQEWDPSTGTDDTSAPVAVLVNSSEMCAADFPLAEVRPLHLDTVPHGGRRTCDEVVVVRNLEGVGSNRLTFFDVPCPQSSCHGRCFPSLFGRTPSRSSQGSGRWGMQDSPSSLFHVPKPNCNRPVEDLVYKDLLTRTFTLTSHERGIKSWCVPTTFCFYFHLEIKKGEPFTSPHIIK
jgi:hypothetical protein